LIQALPGLQTSPTNSDSLLRQLVTHGYLLLPPTVLPEQGLRLRAQAGVDAGRPAEQGRAVSGGEPAAAAQAAHAVCLGLLGARHAAQHPVLEGRSVRGGERGGQGRHMLGVLGARGLAAGSEMAVSVGLGGEERYG